MLRFWIAALLLAVASVWATSVASAQEAPFAFEDAQLDAMPPAANAHADLLRGHAEVVGDSVQFTMTLSLLPEMHVGAAYGFLFTDGTRDMYAVAVSVPELRFLAGEWENGDPGASSDVSGAYTPGVQGSVRVDVPLALFGSATALDTLRGLTADVKTGVSPVETPLPFLIVLDEAQGAGRLTLPAASGPAAPPADEQAAAATPEPSAASAPAAVVAPEDARAVPAPGIAASLLVALALARRRG